MDLGKSLKPFQEKFLNNLKELERSFNTLKNYKTDLECFNHFVEDFLKPKVDELGIPLIEEYGEYLEQKYASNNSRRRRVQTLRIFCDYLIQQGLLTNNPVRKLRPNPKFQDIPRPCPWFNIKTLWADLLAQGKTEKGFVRLLAQRNQVLILLIFGGGLKVSHLEQLNQDDIILDDHPRVIIHPPKRDPFSVPLPEVFRIIYRSYLNQLNLQKKGPFFNQVLFNANPYKILSGGISARGIEKVFEEMRKKLLIEITPKSLRQACIFRWLHQDLDDQIIKEWMGVAPSYDLKMYRNSMLEHYYNEAFLSDLLGNHTT